MLPELLPAALVLSTTLMAAAPERIVIDTDCGVFGDDGVAITMIARHPERARIEGISTVSGNVWATESYGYVRTLLGLLGRKDVPMAASPGAPLIHTAAMADEEARRWGALEFRGAFATAPPGAPALSFADAAAFLIRAIENNPGRLTIIAIGPMTNLAIALRIRPDVETKIRRLVFMGGNDRVPGNVTKAAEFNFWFDPEAAQIVLRSRIPEKIMFGLDVCSLARVEKKHFDQIANADTPVAHLYRDDFGNRYPGFLRNPAAFGYMWDELTAAYLIDPEVVTKSEEHYLDVVTAFGPQYGAVVDLDRRLAPQATPVREMLGVDFERAFSIYRSALIARD